MFSREELTHSNIINYIRRVYRNNYHEDDISLIGRVFDDVVDLFQGKRAGYQACDAQYHSLYHTFQTIPPFVEILDGWNRGTHSPKISKDFFQFGTIGVLLHDTGYIKVADDSEGTGAKYTFTHMQRSIDFAGRYLEEIGISSERAASVCNIIGCTGVTLDINIDFHSDEERITGYALGTADLLGQMSAEDYIEKLPILYNEFAEAYRFEGLDKKPAAKAVMAACADDLIRSTPKFYRDIALARFKLMGSVYECIPKHYGGSENPYLMAIEKNIAAIESKWA